VAWNIIELSTSDARDRVRKYQDTLLSSSIDITGTDHTELLV
jgi:hypothetical protein